MKQLPSDISRCSTTKCPKRFECLRSLGYFDRGARVFTSFYDPQKECDKFISDGADK